jgi:hypothetical protein
MLAGGYKARENKMHAKVPQNRGACSKPDEEPK